MAARLFVYWKSIIQFRQPEPLEGAVRETNCISVSAIASIYHSDSVFGDSQGVTARNSFAAL